MMNSLPASLMNSLSDVPGYDRIAFEKIHASGEQVTSARINPAKLKSTEFIRNSQEIASLPIASPIPWTRFGYYLSQRPSFTFDPLFHAGCYYVQEASSMFLEQAFSQLLDLSKSLRVLDLSAAPGGKSTHIQSLISADSLLVSNEVIRTRTNVLRDNIIKWGTDNVVVTNNDPKQIGSLENYFDVIVVDAPCSGSGLFRRDPTAIAEWREENVALCSQRQQRILADIFPSLKENGLLIYSTCSYSKEEDEEIGEWFANNFPVEYCPLQIEHGWHITSTNFGYRFWPDKLKGEGFFISCFRKMEGDDMSKLRVKNKLEPATAAERSVIEKWINPQRYELLKNKNTVYAWPSSISGDLHFVLSKLKVVYSGARLGELVRNKLLPDHSLAMNTHVSDEVPRVTLTNEKAIQYLQRKEISINTLTGWQLVCYDDHALGWINALPNRINNYYPKELRILKDVKSPPL